MGKASGTFFHEWLGFVQKRSESRTNAELWLACYFQMELVVSVPGGIQ
jgi:hypothetical protein